MKKTLFIVAVALATYSCGPSEKEAKQQIVNTAVQTVCDCFEKNQSDWLSYKKECNEKIKTMRYLIDDDTEGLKQFNEKVAECDKYFKKE